MTRKEKIEHLAGLIYIDVPKQDITDYPLTFEELKLKTLKELTRLADNQLDEVMDKVWEVVMTESLYVKENVLI